MMRSGAKKSTGGVSQNVQMNGLGTEGELRLRIISV